MCLARSPRSMSKSLACWATQGPVGIGRGAAATFAITPAVALVYLALWLRRRFAARTGVPAVASMARASLDSARIRYPASQQHRK